RFAEIKSAQLLVLDDLGTESATPWAREKLYQLFNYRYNTRLPTIITTSHGLEELDPRLVSRMRDRRICQRLVIKASAYLGEAPGASRQGYYGGGYGGYEDDYGYSGEERLPARSVFRGHPTPVETQKRLDFPSPLAGRGFSGGGLTSIIELVTGD